ncbi:MAG TPA: hypothetical protein VJZ27_09465 [Aggregatilineales bacterium]|nr:hypothetical protein [Aggregatilineales bacterium]
MQVKLAGRVNKLAGFSRQADVLRMIAVRVGQLDLRKVMQRPGINEALRLSVYHHDGAKPDYVATLMRGIGAGCRLEVVYDRYVRLNQFYNYDFTIPLERYQKLLAALRSSQFDRIDDETDLPVSGVNLWMIERGSGSFFHDVVLAPASAVGHHREFVIAFRTHLPEAIRELTI